MYLQAQGTQTHSRSRNIGVYNLGTKELTVVLRTKRYVQAQDTHKHTVLLGTEGYVQAQDTHEHTVVDMYRHKIHMNKQSF